MEKKKRNKKKKMKGIKAEKVYCVRSLSVVGKKASGIEARRLCFFSRRLNACAGDQERPAARLDRLVIEALQAPPASRAAGPSQRG